MTGTVYAIGSVGVLVQDPDDPHGYELTRRIRDIEAVSWDEPAPPAQKNSQVRYAWLTVMV